VRVVFSFSVSSGFGLLHQHPGAMKRPQSRVGWSGGRRKWDREMKKELRCGNRRKGRKEGRKEAKGGREGVLLREGRNGRRGSS
jgi:hypothetical protein